MAGSTTEIVLTGGPCGGKTTALSFLQEELMNRGFRVFIVPEVATIFITGGLYDLGRIAEEDPVKFFEIQKQVIVMQMSLRETFLNLASQFPEEDKVLIHDRGPMDSKAYLPEDSADELMKALIKETKFNWSEIRDSFDGVIHLVTAADGAEEFFTGENNEARQETPEEARYLDRRTREAWMGHPRLRVVDNSTNFKGKMKEVLRIVSSILGVPMPIEIERKFLLSNIPDLEDMEEFQSAAKVLIEQTYLDTGEEDEEVRVRKRVQDGNVVYYRTIKRGVPPKRSEKEKRISAVDYREQLKLQMEGTSTVKKTRYFFVYKGQYFELDVFERPEGLAVLEVELTEENDTINLPPFLDIEREVTEEVEFTNFEISKRI